MFRPLFIAVIAATLLIPTAAAEAAEDEFKLAKFPHADVSSSFSNDWGNARSGGRRHQGTDIFGAKGSEVVAVASGTIVAMTESHRAGYYIRIEHVDGWESWYMHLNNDTPLTDDGNGGPETAFAEGLNVGTFVRAGTVIGYVGDSGNAEPGSPHTHFELHNGRAINPYSYLSDVHDRWLRLMDLADELR